MNTRPLIVAFCLAACFGAPAFGADLAKIDRSIKMEPQYKAKAQKYCLLVFEPEAKHRVWLVLDGKTLYVDRNGNGDLTEPGESTTPASENTDPCSFKPITILAPDRKTEETLRFALYGWFDYIDGKETERVHPALFVSWKGRSFGAWGDQTSALVWATQPREAPVLHIDGPLAMGFETRAALALDRTGENEFELYVGVGTKGLGKGAFAHLGYAGGAIPTDVHPTAVLEFPNKTPSGPPIRVETTLTKRC